MSSSGPGQQWRQPVGLQPVPGGGGGLDPHRPVLVVHDHDLGCLGRRQRLEHPFQHAGEVVGGDNAVLPVDAEGQVESGLDVRAGGVQPDRAAQVGHLGHRRPPATPRSRGMTWSYRSARARIAPLLGRPYGPTSARGSATGSPTLAHRRGLHSRWPEC